MLICKIFWLCCITFCQMLNNRIYHCKKTVHICWYINITTFFTPKYQYKLPKLHVRRASTMTFFAVNRWNWEWYSDTDTTTFICYRQWTLRQTYLHGATVQMVSESSIFARHWFPSSLCVWLLVRLRKWKTPSFEKSFEKTSVCVSTWHKLVVTRQASEPNRNGRNSTDKRKHSEAKCLADKSRSKPRVNLGLAFTPGEYWGKEWKWGARQSWRVSCWTGKWWWLA